MDSNISFRQLLTFRTVMQAGSVSEAARLLGRTQPAVSATIAGLEAELGFRLFDRRKGRLVPRAEAGYFLEETEEVLDRLQRSSRTMREIRTLKRGELRIACMPAAASFLLPRLLADFVAERPGVTASLMSRSSAVVEDWIASQQYDLGLAETPEPRESIRMTVFGMSCLCAVEAGHPLAAREVVTPRDLDGVAMAALFPEHGTSAAARRVFGEAGVRFVQRFELQTFLPALELVRKGVCCCICDPITAASYAENAVGGGSVVFRRFVPAVPFSVATMVPAHRPVSLVTSEFLKAVNAALSAFCET
jgi:DNA-binding transcriptional LysR family regulator